MGYNKEEKLKIGEKVYHGELSRFEAANLYGINSYTARDYMRLYRDANNLPAKNLTKSLPIDFQDEAVKKLTSMTKKELIGEILRLRMACKENKELESFY